MYICIYINMYTYILLIVGAPALGDDVGVLVLEELHDQDAIVPWTIRSTNNVKISLPKWTICTTNDRKTVPGQLH